MWYDFLFQPATVLQMLLGQISILLVVFVSATLVLRRMTIDTAAKIKATRDAEMRLHEDRVRHDP